MPLHQHCWNGCVFPGCAIYEISIFTSLTWEDISIEILAAFVLLKQEEKEAEEKTHKQSSYNNAIRLCFATHIRISLRRQQLPSRCICSTCCLIRRPCSKSTLILFVGALVVRNALDIAGSHENRGKYSHDSISQFTRSSSPATSSSSPVPSTKQQQPHHEWMNELHRKSQQLYFVAIVLASCIL